MKYIIGNLLDENNLKDSIIAHGCNALGVMGAGVAAAIKQQFPKCFELYRVRHETLGLKLGDVIYYYDDEDIIIANCITQLKTGTYQRQVNYVAIAKAMSEVCYVAKGTKRVVRIPLIGAGLAGGDWKVISEIIKDCEVGQEVEVFVLDQATYDKVVANGN